MSSKKLTQKYLKSILDYDFETGVFSWKERGPFPHRLNARFVGNKAGYSSHGYKKIGIDYKQYYLHHLAWLYMHGVMPERIDHIDGDGTNNAIWNLRVATQSQNGCNKRKPSNNSSGYKGVFYNNREKRWHARISKQGKQYHIGTFKCPKAAHEAYCKKAEELHGEFARTA